MEGAGRASLATAMRSQTVRKMFGARIKQLRREQEITGPDLAILMGRHQTFVSHLESGRNATNLDTLSLLAETLELDEKDLLNFPELSVRNTVVELTRRVSDDVLYEVKEFLTQRIREAEKREADKQKRRELRAGAKSG
jgi:transcriptional regulator with XRE-family HTH domain